LLSGGANIAFIVETLSAGLGGGRKRFGGESSFSWASILRGSITREDVANSSDDIFVSSTTKKYFVEHLSETIIAPIVWFKFWNIKVFGGGLSRST